MKHLSDEDREYLSFIASLDEDEFRTLLYSMSDSDAMHVLYLLQLAKEEKFDQVIEQYGTPDADDVITYIKNTLD